MKKTLFLKTKWLILLSVGFSTVNSQLSAMRRQTPVSEEDIHKATHKAEFQMAQEGKVPSKQASNLADAYVFASYGYLKPAQQSLAISVAAKEQEERKQAEVKLRAEAEARKQAEARERARYEKERRINEEERRINEEERRLNEQKRRLNEQKKNLN